LSTNEHEFARIKKDENICALLIAEQIGFIACDEVTFSLCDKHNGKIREDSCELVDERIFIHECTRIGTNEEENICVLLIAVHRGFIACCEGTFVLCDKHDGN